MWFFIYSLSFPETSNMATMKKHQSRTHELSGSESEDEIYITQKENRQSMAAKKKTFIDEFLNMSSDDEDSCRKGKTKTQTSDDSEERRVEENRRKIESLKKQRQEHEKKSVKESTPVKHYSEKPHKKNYTMPFSNEGKTDHERKLLKSETRKSDNSSSSVSKSAENTKLNKPVATFLTSESNMRSKHSDSKKVSSSSGDKRRSHEDSPNSSSLKRKHSRSPVPHELRKAVTEILETKRPKVVQNKDKKPPCQYGEKCYRKNPSHFEDFSHPRGKF